MQIWCPILSEKKPRGVPPRAQMPTAATVPSIPHSIFRLQMPIQLFQSCPILPTSFKKFPTCCQDRPRDPNLWPRLPKILPKSLQPDPPRQRCSVVRFYTSAIFLKIAPKTNKNVQKSSPNGLKMAILAPTWKLLAPSWLQLGAILPHLGEILVDPSPAKIDQNQPRELLRDFLSQGRPQELPDPLQTPSRS